MLVEQGIVVTLDMLDAMPSSTEAQTLRRQAESYQRVVRQWSMIPPSAEQRAAMLDLVAGLQAEVAHLL
jgi:hypothetical protein